MEEKFFECLECKKQTKSIIPPECCGEPMQVCTLTSTAEHSRPMDHEEPCDDSNFA